MGIFLVSRTTKGEGRRTHDGVGARVLGPLLECVYAVGPRGVFIDEMLADRLCVHPFAEPGSSDGVESDVYACVVGMCYGGEGRDKWQLTEFVAEVFRVD